MENKKEKTRFSKRPYKGVTVVRCGQKRLISIQPACMPELKSNMRVHTERAEVFTVIKLPSISYLTSLPEP